jgi:hypothetical protein
LTGVKQEDATFRALVRFTVVLAIALSWIAFAARPAHANHVPFAFGDVFAGVGNGKINHYGATGTLKEVLDTTTGAANPPGSETGMCFDSSGKLYTTDYDAVTMSKFNNLGGLTTHPFGPSFSFPPESCVVDQQGITVYVGTGELDNELFKLDTNGTQLNDFTATPDQGGINWVDLNPKNQCELYYTSEGTLVKRFNVCTGTQLSDFASGLPFGSAGCFGLRIRSNGEVLVACDQVIERLNSAGAMIQSYNPANEADFFAIALDPDGASFWAAGYTSGNIYKVNIASGAVSTTFTATPASGAGLGGLAVYGDAATPDPGFVRPRGASPLRASLVPAYKQCTNSNTTHGPPAPLNKPSCTPPVQESGFLTVGTPDANGVGANSNGSVILTAILGNTNTLADEADMRITTNISDVRKKSDLTDYTGQVQTSVSLRTTDRFNSQEPATQPFNDTGTGVDTPFTVTVPCTGTTATNLGSTCSLVTTADTVVPGAIKESMRTVLGMGPVQVFDGGADGVASTSPNTLFEDQGVFVP